MKRIITVNGPIAPEEMGITLSHEHIMVDFIGAAESGKHRYSYNDVIETMLPYLLEIKEYGVQTFIDCTPMYLARDVEILAKLSELSGLHIITNTGQYKEPYLPAQTSILDPAELAEQWIDEFVNGIDGTNIKPGFIKTASNSGELPPIQQKVIKAAAITSINTGLTIATHTEDGVAAMQILDILDETQVYPQKWIYVHAQLEENHDILIEIAKQGAWIELDNIAMGTEEKHMLPLLKLLDAGYEKQILLSQDSGWYNVGEVNGGNIRPYTYLMDRFIPMMEERGVSRDIIDTIMIDNPSRAFASYAY